MRYGLAFSSNNSSIWERIRSDETTKLRLKYDAYYHIFDEQSVRELKRMVRNMSCFRAMITLVFLNILKSKKQPPMPCINGKQYHGARLANGGEFFIGIRRRTRRFWVKSLAMSLLLGTCLCLRSGFIQRKT